MLANVLPRGGDRKRLSTQLTEDENHNEPQNKTETKTTRGFITQGRFSLVSTENTVH